MTGLCADLTVFDPNDVTDATTHKEPARAANGIRHVFVNGRLALDKGVSTDSRAATVLRRAATEEHPAVAPYS